MGERVIVRKFLMPLFLIPMATALAAQDLDVFVSLGLLSPSKNVSNQTVDASGQSTGQLFQPAADFRMLGLGAAYTFLSAGNFRFRGSGEYAFSTQSPGATLRYLGSQLATQYLEAEGTLHAKSINLGATAVYVSSGAGEYGVTFEERIETLEFDMAQVLVSFPGDVRLLSGQRMTKTFTDPFLSVHATFVQHYDTFGLFSRLAYGVDLNGGSSLGGQSAQAFQNLDSGLLGTLRPRQEFKLSLGTRF